MDMVQRMIATSLYEMPDGTKIEAETEREAMQKWEALQKAK